MISHIELWGTSIPDSALSEIEINYLQQLPQKLPSVAWVWEEMNSVWDGYQLNNRLPLSGQAIAEFYSHPVWLMNGFYSSLDTDSLSHRDAIAKYIIDHNASVIADYGGGFGELALKIARQSKQASIDIIEPFPSNYAIHRLSGHRQVTIQQRLRENHYDVIVAQDVLEHIEDPIALAFQLSEALKTEGLVIFANCFYPVIKCHLPSTFHLRHTFSLIMRAYGLSYMGSVTGAEHALVFRKSSALNQPAARRLEKISRLLHPLINIARSSLSKLKTLLSR